MPEHTQNTCTRILSVFLFCIGLSAIAGGYGLIFLNGLGMPVTSLHGVFSSFIIPGLILAFIVGGTHIAASILLWLKSKYAVEATAVAGFGLLVWIFTELYIIREGHWLHVLYFGFAVVTLIVTMLLLKLRKQTDT